VTASLGSLGSLGSWVGTWAGSGELGKLKGPEGAK